jgi:DNA-directed RNA polymerase specialized sigma24 family protein
MDRGTRDSLVCSVLPWVSRLVRGRIHGPDADDAVQDVLLRLLLLAPTFDARRGSPTTWAAIVTKTVLSRRASRRGGAVGLEGRPIVDDRQPKPDDYLAGREAAERAAAAVARLDPADRDLLESHVLDGRPMAHSDRSVSRESARNRFARACRRARKFHQSAPAPESRA